MATSTAATCWCSLTAAPPYSTMASSDGSLAPDATPSSSALVLGATTNDTRGLMAALRSLGALPIDTDIDEVDCDLLLDEEVIDPTTLIGEEMVKEVERVVKALLLTAPSSPRN